MVFTKTETTWVAGSSLPEQKSETVIILGKLQPLGTTEIFELGFNVNDYEYYRAIVSLDATNLDRVRQIKSDTFTIGNRKFRVVGRLPADDAGWREIFCYLDEVSNA